MNDGYFLFCSGSQKGVEVFPVRTCVCWGINLWYVGLSIPSLGFRHSGRGMCSDKL